MYASSIFLGTNTAFRFFSHLLIAMPSSSALVFAKDGDAMRAFAFMSGTCLPACTIEAFRAHECTNDTGKLTESLNAMTVEGLLQTLDGLGLGITVKNPKKTVLIRSILQQWEMVKQKANEAQVLRATQAVLVVEEPSSSTAPPVVSSSAVVVPFQGKGYVLDKSDDESSGVAHHESVEACEVIVMVIDFRGFCGVSLGQFTTLVDVDKSVSNLSLQVAKGLCVHFAGVLGGYEWKQVLKYQGTPLTDQMKNLRFVGMKPNEREGVVVELYNNDDVRIEQMMGTPFFITSDDKDEHGMPTLNRINDVVATTSDDKDDTDAISISDFFEVRSPDDSPAYDDGALPMWYLHDASDFDEIETKKRTILRTF